MISRREFICLGSVSLALTLIDLHIGIPGMKVINQAGFKSVLISEIELITNTDIDKLKGFYHSDLGFPILKATKKSISFKTGSSILSFNYSADKTKRPFYHFAFNIPENKILEAYKWQKIRTKIVMPRPGSNLRDPDYPDDVVNFSNWNAHSIFFHDPAGNLLEYIARHDLNNSASGSFNPAKDVLYISEIAYISDDVDKIAKEIKQATGIKEYRPGDSSFRPIGDEYGLLLVIKKGVEWTAPPGMINRTNVFSTKVEVNMKGLKAKKLVGHPFELKGNT